MAGNDDGKCTCATSDDKITLASFIDRIETNHPNVAWRGKTQKHNKQVTSIRLQCSRARAPNKKKLTSRTTSAGVLSVGCQCRVTFIPDARPEGWLKDGVGGSKLTNLRPDTTLGTLQGFFFPCYSSGLLIKLLLLKGCYCHTNGCLPSESQKRLVEGVAGARIDPQVLEHLKALVVSSCPTDNFRNYIHNSGLAGLIATDSTSIRNLRLRVNRMMVTFLLNYSKIYNGYRFIGRLTFRKTEHSPRSNLGGNFKPSWRTPRKGAKHCYQSSH
jgi:hypothetical protein